MIQYSIKAKEDKVKTYNVYNDEVLDYADGWMGEDPNERVQRRRTFVGQTKAVSPEQAVSRMAYRLGRHVSEVIPWAYDGSRTTTLVAEEE